MDKQQYAATREVQQSVARTVAGKVTAQFGATSRDERDTLEYAFSAYGFLIERNEHLSLVEFAERISRNFDVTVPRNDTKSCAFCVIARPTRLSRIWRLTMFR